MNCVIILIKVTSGIPHQSNEEFMDEVISANYRPADNNINAAVDNLRVDGEDGFGIVCNFVNKR